MMADLKPGRGSDQFPLRLPDGMRERIKEQADRNGRSMNAEIVAKLEQSLLLPSVEISEDLAERIRNSPAEWRANRASMLLDALEEWYPKPQPPRKISITTADVLRALENAPKKTVELSNLLEAVKKRIEAGDLDGAGDADFAIVLKPDDGK